MKRYQVYLDPRSVNILDESAELAGLSRSKLIREAVDAAAGRLGNLLAVIKPLENSDYSWLDDLVGASRVEDEETVNLSEHVDDIYYR